MLEGAAAYNNPVVAAFNNGFILRHGFHRPCRVVVYPVMRGAEAAHRYTAFFVKNVGAFLKRFNLLGERRIEFRAVYAAVYLLRMRISVTPDFNVFAVIHRLHRFVIRVVFLFKRIAYDSEAHLYPVFLRPVFKQEKLIVICVS